MRVILAVAMGGFLNKFMDTMGIELEFETIRDVEPLIGDLWRQGGRPTRLRHVPVADCDGPVVRAHSLVRWPTGGSVRHHVELPSLLCV